MKVAELKRLITRARTTACAAEHAGSLPPAEAEELREKARKAEQHLNRVLTDISLGLEELT